MYYLQFVQKLPLSLEESWDFFSSPSNLKTLTPEYLNFEITRHDENHKMYAGQIITYFIQPLWGLRFEWVTEITHVQEPHYFIDEQRVGPYKFWHHEHRFKPILNGVEMSDIVYYQMPFGLLGKAFHALKVKHDLAAIFSYRHAKLEKMFGSYSNEKCKDVSE